MWHIKLVVQHYLRKYASQARVCCQRRDIAHDFAVQKQRLMHDQCEDCISDAESVSASPGQRSSVVTHLRLCVNAANNLAANQFESDRRMLCHNMLYML